MKVSDGYREVGVDKFYEANVELYDNPHKYYVLGCLDDYEFAKDATVLDIGCGDGLVTKYLTLNGVDSVCGLDKYMAGRYMTETGKHCVRLGFEEIAKFGLNLDADFDIGVMSYMVDIVPDDLLASFIWHVSRKCKKLITIRPNNHELDYQWLEVGKKNRFGKSRLVEYNVTY